MTTPIIYRSINTTEGHKFHIVELPGQIAKPHSINYPAITYADGKQEYYIYGLKHSYEDWQRVVAGYKVIKKATTDAEQ